MSSQRFSRSGVDITFLEDFPLLLKRRILACFSAESPVPAAAAAQAVPAATPGLPGRPRPGVPGLRDRAPGELPAPGPAPRLRQPHLRLRQQHQVVVMENPDSRMVHEGSGGGFLCCSSGCRPPRLHPAVSAPLPPPHYDPHPALPHASPCSLHPVVPRPVTPSLTGARVPDFQVQFLKVTLRPPGSHPPPSSKH